MKFDMISSKKYFYKVEPGLANYLNTFHLYYARRRLGAVISSLRYNFAI